MIELTLVTISLIFGHERTIENTEVTAQEVETYNGISSKLHAESMRDIRSSILDTYTSKNVYSRYHRSMARRKKLIRTVFLEEVAYAVAKRDSLLTVAFKSILTVGFSVGYKQSTSIAPLTHQDLDPIKSRSSVGNSSIRWFIRLTVDG